MLALMGALLFQKPASTKNLVCIFPRAVHLQKTALMFAVPGGYRLPNVMRAPMLGDMIVHMLVGNSNMLG